MRPRKKIDVFFANSCHRAGLSWGVPAPPNDFFISMSGSVTRLGIGSRAPICNEQSPSRRSNCQVSLILSPAVYGSSPRIWLSAPTPHVRNRSPAEIAIPFRASGAADHFPETWVRMPNVSRPFTKLPAFYLHPTLSPAISFIRSQISPDRTESSQIFYEPRGSALGVPTFLTNSPDCASFMWVFH